MTAPRQVRRVQTACTDRGQILTRLVAAASLGLGLLLVGCGAGEPPAAAPAGAAASSALARALETVDRTGLARPQEQQAALQPLLAQARKGSPEYLKALTLAGLFAGVARDEARVRAVAAELSGLAQGDPAPAAALARAVVLARFEQSSGHGPEAVKELAALPALDDERIDPWLRWRALELRGNVLADVGKLDEAAAVMHKALKLASARGQRWQRATMLADLSSLYANSQQIEQARASAVEALQEAQADPDPLLLLLVQTARFIAYSDDPNPAVAQEAAEEALRLARGARADALQALCLANYSDFHLRRGNYGRALALAEDALPLARANRKLSAEQVALHNRGIARIALRRVDEGYRDVRAAIELTEQQGSMASAADSWLELGNYMERAERWNEALHAYLQHRRLVDVVLRDETRKSVLEAQERYAADQRAQEIELLNRDNILMAEQIKQRDLQLVLWAALGGCIVLLATLLGLAYQRMRKTNQALAHSNERLKVQSERDPLTGLANRRHFQAAIKTLADDGKLAGTVFLIDIDHFKRINDVHGHAAGDTVLVEVAKRLTQALREDDLVVRWGGEEFIIVIKTRESAFAQALAQRLLDLIATPPVRHGEREISVTASIGFASFPVAPHDLALSWERAIDLVDTVMYMAKAHGRNKAYGVVSINARDEAEAAALSARLDAACGDGEVVLSVLQGPPQFEASRQ